MAWEKSWRLKVPAPQGDGEASAEPDSLNRTSRKPSKCSQAEGVNPEQIEANLDKGVLCVRVPKMRTEESKKIQVKGAAGEEQAAASGTRMTGGQTAQTSGTSQTQAQGSQGAATTQGGSKEKAA
jgi:hypothetical protein